MQSHHESSMRSSATTLLGTNGGSMMHHSTRYPAMGVGGNGGTDLGIPWMDDTISQCY